ncbi:MAG: hypothetical protein NZ890_05540 [Myxococcota bacterium]|nr:hypothetical protein [Myxococcota bacterium]
MVGAGLLVLPAHRVRPDVVLCDAWPPLAEGTFYGVLYLGGVGLLCACWVRVLREPDTPPLGRVILSGLPVHLVALLGPPFLSQDPLFYAALGRALAAGGTPDTPLQAVLPGQDPFLAVLPPHWRGGTSSYGPGFHWLARGVAQLAHDRLWLQLRLYQATGLLASLGTAVLPGWAAGARAAAGVLFCPLLVVEGTQSGHNDVWLALVTAAFSLLLVRGRRLAAGLALLAGLLVKASALLLLAFYGLSALPWPRRPAVRRALPWLLAAGGVGVGVLLRPWHPLDVLVGVPGGPFEYCTRSIECLPRVLLRHGLQAPGAAWGVGLAFRAAGLVWLCHCALAAQAEGAPLRWAAALLFVYYLYLHAWSQSWYLLPLLPLLPHACPRLRPAMLTLLGTATAYYALAIPFACVQREWAIALVDLAQGLVVVVPPTAVLYRRLRHG